MRCAAVAEVLSESLNTAFVLYGDESAFEEFVALSIGSATAILKPIAEANYEPTVKCGIAVYDTLELERFCGVACANYSISLSPLEVDDDSSLPIDEVILRARPPLTGGSGVTVTAGIEYAIISASVKSEENKTEAGFIESKWPVKRPVCIALSAARAHPEIAGFWDMFDSFASDRSFAQSFLVPSGAVSAASQNIRAYGFDELASAAVCSKLAVTRTGITAYELAYLGIPSIYWVSDDRYSWLVNDLVNCGFGVAVTGGARNLLDSLNDEKFLANVEQTTRNTTRSVDGLGAERIADVIKVRLSAIRD
ncbi:hypothetical protein SSPSH_003647 [Salinisphaera shabanensis E1L3A]|uniref:Uncharacterized protein n=2 Tax=Salinisphaera shabanensis TaxID=180542 RepID=U2EGM8_9GAMM|nr:hypothetical protein SSPSH_003647 [Salinisphaera shabanensis E1L3A]